MGNEINRVPGHDRGVGFLGAGVKRPLISGLCLAQLPANSLDGDFKFLNMLIRRRGGVVKPLLGVYKPRHALHAKKLEPSRAHEGNGDLPTTRVHLRITRRSKKGQMTVPACLMLLNIASELPHQGAVVSFHLPFSLGVLGRGLVRGYTQKTEDALVVFQGSLTSVIRQERVGLSIGSHRGISKR